MQIHKPQCIDCGVVNIDYNNVGDRFKTYAFSHCPSGFFFLSSVQLSSKSLVSSPYVSKMTRTYMRTHFQTESEQSKRFSPTLDVTSLSKTR